MPRQPEPEIMGLAAEAAAYAAADFGEVNESFVERLLELAGHIDEALAIDLGTGPADIPIRLANRMGRWHVAALDGSQAMLAIAAGSVEQAGLGERIDLIRGDAKHTDLPTDHFDVVFSNSILHHISETDGLWQEIRRIARPGAIVLLRDLARPSSKQQARKIVQQYAAEESTLLREEFYNSLCSAYTVDEVRRQLDRVGLQTLTVELSSDRHLDIHGQIP